MFHPVATELKDRCFTPLRVLRYCATLMSNKTTAKHVPDIDPSRTMLSQAITKRLGQLGISRRELVRKSGLSRQTIHNIEVDGRVDLAPATLAKLDEHLQWTPGTAYALAKGDSVWLDHDALTREERANGLRWVVTERIRTLSLEDLETLCYQWEWADDADNATT